MEKNRINTELTKINVHYLNPNTNKQRTYYVSKNNWFASYD